MNSPGIFKICVQISFYKLLFKHKVCQKGTKCKFVSIIRKPIARSELELPPASLGLGVAQVTDQFANWLKGWEKRDTGSYLSFYSKNFKIPKDRIKWEASRQRMLKANTNLSIQASNIQISQNGKTMELNFIQKS